MGDWTRQRPTRRDVHANASNSGPQRAVPRGDRVSSGPPDDRPNPAAASGEPPESSASTGGAGPSAARHRSAAPNSTRHPWLITGRIAIALVALLVFTATGWEWAIKSR